MFKQIYVTLPFQCNIFSAIFSKNLIARVSLSETSLVARNYPMLIIHSPWGRNTAERRY